MTDDIKVDTRILPAQFINEEGECVGPETNIPIHVTVNLLNQLLNLFLNKEDEEPTPFLFFIDEFKIEDSLKNCYDKNTDGKEKVLQITYAEESFFRVRPVTHCTSSIPGHSESVICASFSPDGRYLASGSGDTTLRLWDGNTETPQFTCKAHEHWILCIAWSPDGMKLASGCRNSQVCVWDSITGKQLGRTLIGHEGWISAIAWEPLHRNAECRRLASSSKDATIRIWDIILNQTLYVLQCHTAPVTNVRWGGSGLIYSCSEDCNIKVFRAEDGVLCHTLQAHTRAVNVIALNTDYVMRTGAYDPSKADVIIRDITQSRADLAKLAIDRYKAATKGESELMVSGSDDFSLYLWAPDKDKPISKLSGHENIINDVKFSPNMKIIASASFDKSIKVWNGKTGRLITTFHGHAHRVHQIAWAPDSRLLVSASADSTLKLWDVKTYKIVADLPGHADEIYAVDWSPDGKRVVSGGNDKVIKIWRNMLSSDSNVNVQK